MIEHGPAQHFLLKDLLPCLHFSQNLKKFDNLEAVKLTHLFEIQNTAETCMRFKVQGSGLGAYGSGFRVEGYGFRV